MFRKAARELCVLCLIALCPALVQGVLGWQSVNPKQGAKGSISLTEIRHRALGVTWIDARSRTEFEKSHIPGAILLTDAEWDEGVQKIMEIFEPGQTLVVYCSGSGCQVSAEVAEELRLMGFNDVFYLEGGFELWGLSGYEVSQE